MPSADTICNQGQHASVLLFTIICYQSRGRSKQVDNIKVKACVLFLEHFVPAFVYWI